MRASQLYGCENHYKIKLSANGNRLVYEALTQEIKNLVYKKAVKRQKG
jgi:hypothetical protein